MRTVILGIITIILAFSFVEYQQANAFLRHQHHSRNLAEGVRLLSHDDYVAKEFGIQLVTQAAQEATLYWPAYKALATVVREHAPNSERGMCEFGSISGEGDLGVARAAFVAIMDRAAPPNDADRGHSLNLACVGRLGLIHLGVDGANLENVYLHGADLTGFYLPNANLRGANLEAVDLSYVMLDGADLTGAVTDGATCLKQTGMDLWAAPPTPDFEASTVQLECPARDEADA